MTVKSMRPIWFLIEWNHGKWGSRNWCFVLARPFSSVILPMHNFTGRDLENVATSYKNHYFSLYFNHMRQIQNPKNIIILLLVQTFPSSNSWITLYVACLDMFSSGVKTVFRELKLILFVSLHLSEMNLINWTTNKKYYSPH